MAIRIAVDAMGGDHAPNVVVEGAVRAVKQMPDDLRVLLLGPEETVRTALGSQGDGLAIEVVDAPEVIGMAESPASAVKTKQRSSIHVGLGGHRQRAADAFVSAGNTGAIMAAALFILGRPPGVARPSVIGFFPTTKSYCLFLDVGTNVDCRPEHLLQFARMGSIYASLIMKRTNPVVALMNVGEEPGKGNDLVKAAYPLLADEPSIHFRGNMEGRDVMHHAADVIVCDGFVGNVMLKLGESMATAFPQMMNEQMDRLGLSGEARANVSSVLRGLQGRFDYQEYGGVPLLGVNGNVLIGHGASSARAIERMILAAVEYAREDVAGAIASALGETRASSSP